MVKHILIAAVGIAIGGYLAKKGCAAYSSSSSAGATKFCTATGKLSPAQVVGAAAGAFFSWQFVKP